MSALERRVAEWPEVIGDLLLQHLPEFPRRAVGDAIAADFGTQLSWNWMERTTFGFELREPLPGWPEPGVVDFWERAGLGFHPLIRWFAHTGCPSPMTVGRVPREIAPEACVAALRACMEPSGWEQQLSIPYVLAPDRHRAFVLARSSEDFSAEDLEVARRLQPLLVLLERQVQVLGGQAAGFPDDADQGLLTGRERAVLVLLERGCTAEAIAHRLGISPRTVHKHLENLYRKLGVGDRLRAVVVAKEARLLTAPRPGVPVQRTASREDPPDRYGLRWSGHVPACGWAIDVEAGVFA